MNAAEIRESWIRFREDASARAEELKQSNDALRALFARYRSLSDAERPIVDEWIIEQLASVDEIDRFDALALIREFQIRSAVPALRKLADWLEDQPGPGAPYEWAKVNRLIGNLANPT